MVSSKEIAEKFELEHLGLNREVSQVTSLNNQCDDGITWVKSSEFIGRASCGVVVVEKGLPVTENDSITFLVSDKSVKLTFIQVLKEFFEKPMDYYLENCVDEHRKNTNIKIGSNVFIGKNVTIGNGTVITHNVVIEAGSVIGEHCFFKPHVSIGTEGYGLAMNEETNLYEKFPQLGNVVIEDHVEIGPTSTIRRGALDKTIIQRGTKIGSLVNIGHNCIVGKNCIFTSNVTIPGSSVIGDDVYLGVNVAVRNAVKIGSNSLLGMGSIVTKDIPDDVVVYGNPARIVRKNL